MSLKIELLVYFVVCLTWFMSFQSSRSRRSASTFCYYTDDGERQTLLPDRLNGTLCDHLTLGFADIENNEIVPKNQHKVRDRIWLEVLQLKKRWPHLKVLLSVGPVARKFSDVTSNSSSLQMLVSSAVWTILKYGFDGLDIDWEFPAWNGMPTTDRFGFVHLLRELRHSFDKLNTSGEDKKILLTAAVAAPITIVDTSYIVPEIALHVDYCFLMGYDFNRFSKLWPVVDFNSPLYRHRGQILFLSMLNLVEASQLWLDKGMLKEKLVVGIPFYGVSFKLADKNLVDVGSPAVGTGILDGTPTYPQMCQLLENSSWTMVFHNESLVPYAYRQSDWISFENSRSISEKAEWILSNNFAGIMSFSLNLDDFNGTCQTSEGDFALQTIIYEAVQKKKTGVFD